MKVCLISGSFDPITLGHMDIIKRASKMFDKIIIGVFNNEEKTYLFDMEKRVKLCSIATKSIYNVEVKSSKGMVFDFCRENNINYIVRGFRDEKDYAYETEMARFNFEHSSVKTILLAANDTLEDISSSRVREFLQANEKQVEKYLPFEVLSEIRRTQNEWFFKNFERAWNGN